MPCEGKGQFEGEGPGAARGQVLDRYIAGAGPGYLRSMERIVQQHTTTMDMGGGYWLLGAVICDGCNAIGTRERASDYADEAERRVLDARVAGVESIPRRCRRAGQICR